ncbi:hypothetical protein OYE22_30555 [Streptomyces sp. 71268]|uniref:hypothetical protein n=1 Tax=Streptomyces sp. 71268 TaxID=3002640 RepID=UPI0023F6E4BC|nr:hypothetical protein [Streptomyces sp. 71268]WEV29043.1 hypothetical protein OYE22_30555 [Streptomyces sp. 71268]
MAPSQDFASGERTSRPILAHVEPVPGGLYGGQPYEVALSDLRAALAEVSATLSGADSPAVARLTDYKQDLNRAQLQLRPNDMDAILRAHAPSRARNSASSDGASKRSPFSLSAP